MSPDDLTRWAHAAVFPALGETTVPDWARARIDAGLGGFVLFGQDIVDAAQLTELNETLHELRGDLVIAIDEEGGDVTRLHDREGSPYPGNQALGQLNDLAATRSIGRQIGLELNAADVDLDLAPAVDTLANPFSPNGVRCFSGDRNLTSAHGASWIEGLQSTGVVACAKHFPGHGLSATDAHLGTPVVTYSREDILGTYLAPFRASVEAGVGSIMVSHVVMSALDTVPATLSHVILTDVLRGRLGFEGMVITDALDMRGVAEVAPLPQAAVRAIAAGADALCLGAESYETDARAVVDALVAAVRSGDLAEDRLAEAAARVERIGHRPRTARHLPRADPSQGLHAARRALSRTGDVLLGSSTARIVTFDPPPSPAAGPVPWGLAEPLRRAGIAVTEARITASGPTPEQALASAGDGAAPLVVVVRSPHRYDWQRDGLAALLVREPRAIVVDMGIPALAPAGARGHISTFGAARCCGQAAAEALLGTELPEE